MNRSETKAFFRILCAARKGIFCALLLCAFVAASCSLAEAAEGYFEIGRDDESIYSLLTSSVEMREQYGNEYVVGWIKTIIRKPEQEKPINGKKPSHSMSLWACNPELKQIQILSATYYDKDGKVLSSDSESFATFRWQDCIPNTVGEGYWYAIMAAYFGDI